MFARVSSDTTIKVVLRRSYASLGLQKQNANPLLFCFLPLFPHSVMGKYLTSLKQKSEE